MSEPEVPDLRLEVLRSISLGERVAEDEAGSLAAYFVETEPWRRVWQDEVDVIFAPKGGGKSAIYSMLTTRESDLFDRGVLLAAGENPTGSTAFSELKSDPATTEAEFLQLWKLYFLSLIARVLDSYDVRNKDSQELLSRLRAAGLLPETNSKVRIIRNILDYIKCHVNPQAVETIISVDPATGIVSSFGGRITFGEPSASDRFDGAVSIDDLFELADGALAASELSVWLVLDRLDVAFADSVELEENALRALFRVYRDLQPLKSLRLKIFLRSDIWRAITSGGFREASHITRELSLEWSEATLMQLVVQRMVSSMELCRYVDSTPAEILASVQAQNKLFQTIFPSQVDLGPRKSKTFDWVLARTRDGFGKTAPRELIHLFSMARTQQLNRYGIGQPPPAGRELFDRQALKDALPEVSETRLTKTLYAEYPLLRARIASLEEQKTHQSSASLSRIWNVNESEAGEIATRLVEIGFFERRGDRQSQTYWVPFLYRSALHMVQGSAEGLADSDE